MHASNATAMLVAAIAACLISAGARADVKLPAAADIPIPAPRPVPAAPAPSSYAPDAAHQASRALTALKENLNAAAATPRDIGPLKDGLGALSRGDIDGALRTRDALPADALDRRILSWAVALNGGDVTFRELSATAADLTGWPGQAAMRRNIERALYRQGATPGEVAATIGDQPPRTFEGVVAATRAQVALGHPDKALAMLSPFWRKEKLEPQEEALILREFGALLSKADHRARMEQMLHAERVNSALRIAERAGAGELAKAWGAVLRKERNAGKLLDAVPKAQRQAGWLFAKARHLRWGKNYKEAAAVMLQAPTDAAALVDPDAWWIERRVLSRELLDLRDPATAYRLASAHAAESPAMAADAEFHAGWYALRGLHDAEKAAPHFRRIGEIAGGPISLARAHYWLGRATEVRSADEARQHFERAAQYGTTFYGQLAAAKLGRTTIVTDYPSPEPAERSGFAERDAVKAIGRLEAAGYQKHADMLYRALADELTSAGELALLGSMAERRGDHHLALRIGKIAAARGLDIGALAHPLGAIPAAANVSGSGKALAYAIARQESEFNAGAVSPAGARGLLQLLPGTARAMAKRAGVTFNAGRLVTDAAYNTSLGAAYLGDQLSRFDGSYVLTFAGYNAGPGRAVEWIKRYGDPRGKNLDAVVDWIERIPFTETRNYVQRVMENYQVYKMRLSGRFDIAGDLMEGRRR